VGAVDDEKPEKVRPGGFEDQFAIR
jgi:hypothetical protein